MFWLMNISSFSTAFPLYPEICNSNSLFIRKSPFNMKYMYSLYLMFISVLRFSESSIMFTQLSKTNNYATTKNKNSSSFYNIFTIILLIFYIINLYLY